MRSGGLQRAAAPSSAAAANTLSQPRPHRRGFSIWRSASFRDAGPEFADRHFNSRSARASASLCRWRRQSGSAPGRQCGGRPVDDGRHAAGRRAI